MIKVQIFKDYTYIIIEVQGGGRSKFPVLLPSPDAHVIHPVCERIDAADILYFHVV